MSNTQATQDVCDVLVAGSGAGGFAAALTAHLHGLDVIMAEKTPLFGGTTAYSSGIIWIPNNSHQRAAGIADSREAALTYLTHHIGNRLDLANAETFLDDGPAMLDLFEREGFVSFSPGLTFPDYHPDEPGASEGGRALFANNFDGRRLGAWFDKLRSPIKTMTVFGGMMVGRTDLPHVFQMTRSVTSAVHVGRMLARYARDRMSYRRGTRLVNGNALIASLATSAFARGIPLWLNSPIVELVSEAGRIVGAIVERDGRRQRIEAHRGVVLACGGFPGNEALKRRAYQHVGAGKSHVALPPAGNSGDGLRLAQSVGGTYCDDLHHPAAWTPASGRRFPRSLSAFLRARQARLHQCRPPRSTLCKRSEILPCVRSGHDRSLPRRQRCGSLDRL
jgi:succinate dehydrogenase/fumarate reductase flavoprotein subunit